MNWWGSVVAMEIRKILAYRSDFWVTFLGQTLLQLFIATALWKSIFLTRGVTELNGFTLPLLSLYYLCVPLCMKIMAGSNVGFISSEIYNGTFNRYLLYPLTFFTFKTLTYLTYSVFYVLQLVVLFFLFHLFTGYEFPTGYLFNLPVAFILIFTSALVYMGLAMAVELCALWAENTWSLMVIVRFVVLFCGGGFLPITFFPVWAQDILKFTPFPYLLDLPIRTIMNRATLYEIGDGFLILVVWIFITHGIARLVWRAGEKNYAGVGI